MSGRLQSQCSNSLQVKDSNGHILYNKDDIKEGKFAFTTDAYDVYEVCFTTKMPSEVKGGDREVQLLLKHGAEAKNYQGLADVGKLKPLEVSEAATVTARVLMALIRFHISICWDNSFYFFCVPSQKTLYYFHTVSASCVAPDIG